MSRKKRIETLLNQELHPDFLSVEDESQFHHVPAGAQSHFKVLVVSPQFKSIKRLERHKLVKKLLINEFSLGLHALSLHLFSPEEWTISGKSILKSPGCKDGFEK